MSNLTNLTDISDLSEVFRLYSEVSSKDEYCWSNPVVLDDVSDVSYTVSKAFGKALLQATTTVKRQK